MNKYQTWYQNITDRARDRELNGYVERHHIIPESLGGSDDADNLVKLTAREHFICHWLLTKIYTGEAKSKMIYALNGMKRNGKCTQRYETLITSRVYEKLKKEFSIVHSATMKGKVPINKGVPMSEEQKAAIRATKAANPTKMSAESIARRSDKIRGQKRTEEQKNNIRQAVKAKLEANPRGPMSDLHKEAISQGTKGKAKPPGQGAAISATVAAQRAAGTHYSQVKIQCPHCPVLASKARYNAFHGDKCKQRDTT
jgi:hypothetical protein